MNHSPPQAYNYPCRTDRGSHCFTKSGQNRLPLNPRAAVSCPGYQQDLLYSPGMRRYGTNYLGVSPALPSNPEGGQVQYLSYNKITGKSTDRGRLKASCQMRFSGSTLKLVDGSPKPSDDIRRLLALPASNYGGLCSSSGISCSGAKEPPMLSTVRIP